MRVNRRVIYEIRTIYVPVTIVVPGVSSKRVKKIQDWTRTAESQDPQKKEEMEKLKAMVAAILSKLRSVPGAGMKESILGSLEAIMSMAEGGNLQGALNFANTVASVTDKAIAIGANLMTLLNRAKNMAATLGGAAGAAMARVVARAESVLETATDPTALADISNILERAVDLGKKIEGVPKGSTAYYDHLAELESLGGWGESKPAMEGDKLGLSFGAGREVLRGLIDKATDPFQVEKLTKLQGRLNEIQSVASQLPQGLQDEVTRRVNQLITTAANGNLDGALKGADELLAFARQAAVADKALGAKLDRLEGLSSRMSGPGAELVSGVLEAARAGREQAASPEDLQALDAKVMQAIELADKLANCRPGDVRAGHLAKRLSALEQELSAKLPKPSFGDALSLSGANQGPPASPGAHGPDADFAHIAAMIDKLPPESTELTPEQLDKLSRQHDTPAAQPH